MQSGYCHPSHVPRGTNRSPLLVRERSPYVSTVQKPKSRLGRGLSSLISVSDLPVEAEISPPPGNESTPQSTSQSAINQPIGPEQIHIDQISPNPHQPRRQMNESSIA